MRLNAVLGFIALLSFAAGAAQPRSFVASSGSDANACTLASPCRSFATAIAQTNAGGEVIVLDSAGYGPVSITKSISLIAPAGVYAAITVASGTGVAIDAMDATVVLRGISITGAGGWLGMTVANALRVRIENCVISGMNVNAVAFFAPGSEMAIVDTIIRDNGGIGIVVGDHTGVVIDHVRIEHNGYDGVHMNTTSGQTTVSIVDSVIAFNGRNGVWGDVSSAADLALGIERTSVIGNAEDGIRLQTSTGPLRATVARNVIERNGFNGIEMIGQSISADLVATITDNSISANGADGIHCAGNGPNISYAYVSRNAVNGQSFAFDIGANCAFGSYNDNTGTGGINGTTNVVTAF